MINSEFSFNLINDKVEHQNELNEVILKHIKLTESLENLNIQTNDLKPSLESMMNAFK